MSCCGQKRTEYMQELQNSASFEPENSSDFASEEEKQPKLFEYTGNKNLVLKGISSGDVYHFRFRGERLEVNYYDSFAMMAERDLKVAL